MKHVTNEQPRKYWDEESATYDTLYLDRWSKLEDKLNLNLIASSTSHLEFLSVLDLGCGTGLSIELIEQLDKNYEYLGIDISAGMIEVARVKYPEHKFILWDIDQGLDLKGSFNAILGINGTLSYSQDAAELTKKIAYITKTDGIIILSCYSRWNLSRIIKMRFTRFGDRPTRKSHKKHGCRIQYFSKQGMRSLLNEAGFKVLYLGSYSVLGRLVEFPILWKFDRLICNLVPNLGHTLIAIAKK